MAQAVALGFQPRLNHTKTYPPTDTLKDLKRLRYRCHFHGCGKRFERKYNLKCHERIHSNEKPYSCIFASCRRTFRWKSSLNHHLMSVAHISDVEAAALSGSPILPARLAGIVKRRRACTLTAANRMLHADQKRPTMHCAVKVAAAANLQTGSATPVLSLSQEQSHHPHGYQNHQTAVPIISELQDCNQGHQGHHMAVPNAPEVQHQFLPPHRHPSCNSPTTVTIEQPPAQQITPDTVSITCSDVSGETNNCAPSASLQEFLMSVAGDENLTQFLNLSPPLDHVNDDRIGDFDRAVESLAPELNHDDRSSQNRADPILLTDSDIPLF